MAKGTITGKELISDDAISRLDTVNEQIKSILKNYEGLIKTAQKFTTPSQGNRVSKAQTKEEERFNIAMKERVGILKKIAVQEERNKVIIRQVGEDLAKQRYETQKINKANKQAAILTSKYADAYDKLGVKTAKAERHFKNMVILYGKNAAATRTAEAALKKYNSKIREADQLAGNFKRSVGDYKTGFAGIKNTLRQLVGVFGVVEGLRLGATLIKDSIEVARAAKGVEFAFDRLGEKGVKAFDDIQKSTRGLLSELDIKKSIVEFENFNLNLGEAGTLFEFVALRASQTGKSVEYLRDSLVEGLSKESLLRLDNLGVSANDLRREMDEFGLSVTQAFAKLAKAEIEEAGNQLDEAANGAERFDASLNNISLGFGKIFTQIKGLGAINDFLDRYNTGLKLANHELFENKSLLGFMSIGFRDLTEAGREENKRLVEEIEHRKANAKAIREEAAAFIKRNNSQSPLPQGHSEKQEDFTIFGNVSPQIRDVETLNNLIQIETEKKQGLTIADKARRVQIDAKIESLKKERDAILGVTSAVSNQVDKTPELQKVTDVFQKEFKESENVLIAFKKVLPEIFDFSTLSTDEYEKLLTDVVKITEEKGADLEKIYSGVFDTFEGFYGVDMTAFKSLMAGKKADEQDYANFAKSLSGAILDSQLIRYENQITANQERLDAILNDDSASEEKKKQAQIEADKVEKKIRLKQAKAERKNVLTQIAIDTAAGIAKALGQTGILAPTVIPTILGLGLAQAAFVASQPLPKYFKGTDNAPGGLAWTDEKGAEIHTDKYGNVKDWGSSKGARIKMTEKGDKIFRADKSKDIINRLIKNEDVTFGNVSKQLSKDTQERTNWITSMSNIDLTPMKGMIEDEIRKGFKNVRVVSNNKIVVEQPRKGYRA